MRSWLKWIAVGLAIACAAWSGWELASRRAASLAEQQNAKIPVFARAQHIRHGINVRPSSELTSAEIRQLRDLGFDHVRLIVDPEPLILVPQTGALRPEEMAKLDKSVDSFTAAGLNVVLNVQPDDNWKTPLEKGDDAPERFFAFWTQFATHFANTDPEKVFFEVLNEPTMDDTFRWEGIQEKAVARIHRVAPRHTVIATASLWSGIDRLIDLSPLRDDNVIYTFHEYDPMWFTHQGASWGFHGWQFLRGVPYPTTPKSIQRALEKEPDELERLRAQRLGWDRWDAARINQEVSAISAWGESRKVPLYCGEFGVYKKFAKPRDRVRWTNDVRTALDEHRIGWAMWEYDGDFGLMGWGPKGRIVDQALLSALGLGH